MCLLLVRILRQRRSKPNLPLKLIAFKSLGQLSTSVLGAHTNS